MKINLSKPKSERQPRRGDIWLTHEGFAYLIVRSKNSNNLCFVSLNGARQVGDFCSPTISDEYLQQEFGPGELIPSEELELRRIETAG